MSADADLLRRYADQGAEAAFTELVRRHIDLVYGAALRRCGGDAHRAEDVTQQVFTALARQARSLAHHTVLTAWLYTTTRNIAVDLIRAEHSRAAREQEAAAMRNILSAGQPDADWTQLRPVLDDAMDELADADRTAILLRYFQQRPFAEIGATLRVSEDAARMRVERALDKLRVLLARRGVTSTSAVLTTALAHEAAVAAPAGLVASVSGVALGGAATTGTGAFLAFMSTTKVTISLTVAAVLAIGLAVYQSHRADAFGSEVARARAARDGLTVRLADLETKTKAAATELAEATAALESQRLALAAEAAAKTAAQVEKERQNKTLQQLLKNDPQLQQLQRDYDRHHRMFVWGPLFQGVGLTSAQIEQTLMEMERRMAVKWGKYPSNAAPAELPAALAADERFLAFNDSPASPEGSAGTREYDAANWQSKYLIEDIASTLNLAAAPLNAGQAVRLRQTFWDAVPHPVPEDKPGPIPLMRNLDWDRVAAEAAGYLSPAQVNLLGTWAARGRRHAQIYAIEHANK